MKQRVINPNNGGYPRYGGRGITLCPEWNDFECFLRDMGPRPSAAHSIDRIDNNAGYCRENCRWATTREQSNNKRSSHFLGFGGQRLTVAQWAAQLGWVANTIAYRMTRGWSTERTLTQEPRKKK